MSSMILINTVQLLSSGEGGGPQTFLAGATIADAGIQTLLLAAGGQLIAATDTYVAAAALVVAKLRQKGQANEELSSRYMMAAATASAYATAAAAGGEQIVHATFDVPLATINAKTSGTAFNVGTALPANAKLLSSSMNVIATVTGGTLSAVVATLQNTGETAGAIQGSKSVFAATGVFSTAGSNPQPNRGGQQLQCTMTATGDTLANATTGHVAFDVYYSIVT